MTPDPGSLLRTYWIFDPSPGSFHFRDLVNQIKDGVYAKDRTSAYIAGLFLFAKEAGMITAKDGELLQIPFIEGMVLRVKHPNFGHPFLDPDGNVMKLGDRILNGSIPEGSFQVSTLNIDDVKNHAGFDKWFRVNYQFRGATETYVRVSDRNSKKECDAWVNGQQYTPGPLSVPLAHYPLKDDVEPAGNASKKRKLTSAPKGKMVQNSESDDSQPKPRTKKQRLGSTSNFELHSEAQAARVSLDLQRGKQLDDEGRQVLTPPNQREKGYPTGTTETDIYGVSPPPANRQAGPTTRSAATLSNEASRLPLQPASPLCHAQDLTWTHTLMGLVQEVESVGAE